MKLLAAPNYCYIISEADLESERDGINGYQLLPGIILKSSSQKSLREEKSRNPKHLETHRLGII